MPAQKLSRKNLESPSWAIWITPFSANRSMQETSSSNAGPGKCTIDGTSAPRSTLRPVKLHAVPPPTSEVKSCKITLFWGSDRNVTRKSCKASKSQRLRQNLNFESRSTVLFSLFFRTLEHCTVCLIRGKGSVWCR